MAYLVDRKNLIWLEISELREALKDLVNFYKEKPTKNLKHAVLTVELFLAMKGKIEND